MVVAAAINAAGAATAGPQNAIKPPESLFAPAAALSPAVNTIAAAIAGTQVESINAAIVGTLFAVASLI